MEELESEKFQSPSMRYSGWVPRNREGIEYNWYKPGHDPNEM